MNLNKKEKLLFEDFNLQSGLLLGLYAMGFQNGPSDIQSLILPYSLANQSHRNIIVQSKTGTGKNSKRLDDEIVDNWRRFRTSDMFSSI